MRTAGRHGLEKRVQGFGRARILVVGDIMMDLFIRGRVSRISPEAPVPVVAVDKEDFLPGGAANVAHNIRALGGQVTLCSIIGEDEMGERMKAILTGCGTGIDGIWTEPDRQTTVKTRVIAHHQQVVRIDRETVRPLKPATAAKILNYLTDAVEAFDGVILSDYDKGMLTKDLARAVIRRARRAGRFVLVDPKPKNLLYYRGATVVTPNTAEAGAAAGIAITDDGTLERAGRRLLKRLGCQALVITRGEEGMAVFEPHQKTIPIPTVAREVYDVTGAGDTVIGTMALALAGRASYRDAACLGNYAAGIVVGKRGTATASPEELVRVIRETFV
jgi:rfaE bifunctional protein kinase chain/domain